ncbi:unnamed protein product [Prorocentrum cordatum]|uniref:Tim10-like domain-containing protein n=1 Tax=Prorocentrum cordatum TaxID=2364126 RepID=A0ABN9QYI7_9DINO|nr:unnamed protein product [Polarella glacialis]
MNMLADGSWESSQRFKKREVKPQGRLRDERNHLVDSVHRSDAGVAYADDTALVSNCTEWSQFSLDWLFYRARMYGLEPKQGPEACEAAALQSPAAAAGFSLCTRSGSSGTSRALVFWRVMPVPMEGSIFAFVRSHSLIAALQLMVSGSIFASEGVGLPRLRSGPPRTWLAGVPARGTAKEGRQAAGGMAAQNMMAGMDSLSQKDQAQVLATLNDMQMQESMNTYNNLVERCFNECVTSFRTKALESNEEQCVKRCVQKFMSFSQRVAQRFQEKQQQMGQKMCSASAAAALRRRTRAVGALGRRRSWQAALGLLWEAEGPGAAALDGIACSAGVAACAAGRQWALSLALLREARAAAWAPGTVGYNAVLGACMHAWASNSAPDGWVRSRTLCLLEDMRSLALETDAATYNAAIQACGSRWRLALSFLVSGGGWAWASG